MAKFLVTGAAGFIGSHLTFRLLERGDEVIGVDNHNSYYDTNLKEARLARYQNHPNYIHIRMDLANRKATEDLFDKYVPTHVVNLAAQAGVRYSIEDPLAYIDSNIVAFAHVLEGCRRYKVNHLVYASSSSVYGSNQEMPFKENHNVDHPLNVYAASKKSNELMAHSYSHLYGLPTTGLRFFTVYGPWGRPDMALHKFTKAIIANEKIPVFNYGNHIRDFTYIDDVIEGLIHVLDGSLVINGSRKNKHLYSQDGTLPWRLYNLGSNNPIKLLDCISCLEKALGRSAKIEFLPQQPGDMHDTYASVDNLVNDFGYKPKTSLDKGVANFVAWYIDYYKVNCC